MKALMALTLVLSLFQVKVPPQEPLRLKSGDVVQIVSTVPGYGFDYTIMPDGAIYGSGFGRVVLEGKTWERAQADVRYALRRLVKEREVFLAIKSVHEDLVFIAAGQHAGPFKLTPGLTLRQLLAAAPAGEESDTNEVILFHGRENPVRMNLARVMRGEDAKSDVVLAPNDVISVLPNATMRVWVTGLVRNPGLKRLPPGSDLQQALASAGGIGGSDGGSSGGVGSAPVPLPGELSVTIRRGPETFTPSLVGPSSTVSIESGDVINVAAPETFHLTVGGSVSKPGELVVKKGTSLYSAITSAGGTTPEGSLKPVYVFRKGELLQFDGTPQAEGAKTVVEAGDLIFVNVNERAYFVLGEVTHPAKYLIVDGSAPIHLTDALSAAGGLGPRGTMRRVAVGRAGKDGRLTVTAYNLDEFLKDGKVASNPEIKPGDTIYFTTAKSFDIATITQVISSYVLVRSVSRL